MTRLRAAATPTVFMMFVLLSAALGSCFAETMKLERGWRLQSSHKVREAGEVLSSRAYQPTGWYSTSIPSTVLAAQVAAGDFPDPYVGMNLRKIPGTTYRIGLNSFNNVPMDPDSPYARSWWYRTTFRLPRTHAGKTTWLHFNGINYRANIWLNGRKLADSKDVAGAYRIHEFDVSSYILPGQENVLTLEVFAPAVNELGINWVDWNPAPPDKSMGIWGDVYLSTTGPVAVRYPQAVTHFPDDSLNRADLTVTAEVRNASDKSVKGVVEALVDSVRLRQNVELQPHEARTVSFTPDAFPELKIEHPKLWWPVHMGPQNLHDLTVRFLNGTSVSDSQHVRFGIREVTSELTDRGFRLFRVNGKRVLIRGAAWTQDMLLRRSRPRMEAQLDYVLDMNLNTIRLEAQLDEDAFFDLADEKGLLVMAGWCCCDIWERWKKWTPETLQVATESLRTQLLRLRSHPSMMVWLNGSDGPPPADVERAYLATAKAAGWPNPVLSSASDEPTTVTGPSGVKMSGPYDYEPPSYWLVDKKHGGAHGFNTETSPGAAIPTLASLRKMLPGEHLWPVNEVWSFHSAGERFQTMDAYHQAMNKTFGPPSGIEDYVTKSQAMAYDGQRAMFEAYGRNKYVSTGVIQWMLNNAWPSLFWHLYDYYLQPAGGYFGTRKACEPLHVQYSYDDGSVVIVNSHIQPFTGLTVNTRLYDQNLKPIFTNEAKTDVDSDSVKVVVTVPPMPQSLANAVYFLDLKLLDSAGKTVSSNFYWLPSKFSTLDWEKTHDSAYTPIAEHEDLTALQQLPRVRLSASVKRISQPQGDQVQVMLKNPSNNLAFQVHLGIGNKNSEEEIVPVLWDDNYLALLPGESKVITARYRSNTVIGADAVLRVDGWNIEPTVVPLSAARATTSKRGAN